MLTFSRLGRMVSVAAVTVATALGAITVVAQDHASTSGARSIIASPAGPSGAIVTEHGVCGCALT